MYYGKEMSLAEIAEVYGVTVSRISQILKDARGKLRVALEPLVEGTDLLVGTTV
jgi:RNA polymerase sigma factor (sigma-70 family)